MKKDNTKKLNRLTEIVEVDYPQSKESIWNLMEDKLTEQNNADNKVRKLSLLQWAAAASIVVLLGIGSFMRLYQVDYSTAAGEHFTAELPDGSTVDLNGKSTLHFNPYWWRMKRTVRLEGEGYFEVENGRQFSVASNNGVTTVLGTSFNIYTRDTSYEVNCITGKVEVEVMNGVKKIIFPNQQAILNNNQLDVSESNGTHSIDWLSSSFYFSSTPLKRVFKEIEIAYNVIIEVQAEDIYSGNFKKMDNIEDVLKIVCLPLNLKFVKQQTGSYLIKNN